MSNFTDSLKGLSAVGIGAVVIMFVIGKAVDGAGGLPGLAAETSAILYIVLYSAGAIFAFSCLGAWTVIELQKARLPTNPAQASKPNAEPTPNRPKTKTVEQPTLAKPIKSWIYPLALLASLSVGFIVNAITAIFPSAPVESPPIPNTSIVPISICIGEHPGKCPANAIWSPCGTDVQNFADKQCSGKTSTVKKLLSVGGNKCGYLVADVYCPN